MKAHFKFFLTLGLAAAVLQPLYAIKISVPKEYEAQLQAIREAERADLDRRLQAGAQAEVEGAATTESGSGLQFSLEEAAGSEAAAADNILTGSLDEANRAANALGADAAANAGFVSGQVLDKETQQPISGVAIVVEGSDIGTISDSQGRYTLGPAPAGSYTISFIKSGYIEANVTDFAVVAGEVSVFPFALPPRPADMSDEVYVLQDFTVSAEEANDMMSALELKMSSVNVLSALGSEDFSKFAASDLGEAIKRVSGVSVVGGKYAVIRGLGDRYINSSLNGLPVSSPDPDRQALQLDLFPSGLFDSLEVTKSFTPNQAANSTGGINMKIKKLPEEFFATLGSGVGGHSIASGNDNFLTSNRVTSMDRWANGAEDRALPGVATSFPEDLTKAVWPQFLVNLGIPPAPGTVTQAQKDLAVAEAENISDSLGRNLHNFGDSPEFDHSFKFSMGDSYSFSNEAVRLGFIGGLNYSRKARMVEDATFFRSATPNSGTDTLSPETFLDPTKATGYENKKRTTSSYTSTFSWLLGGGIELFDNHSIRFHRLDLRISEDENTRVVGDRFDEFAPDAGYTGTLVQEYSESIHYQERRLISDQILGEHLIEFSNSFFFDEALFNWGFSSDESSQNEPGFIQTRAKLRADNGNFTLAQNLSATGGAEPQFAIWREIDEEKRSQKFDLEFQRDLDGRFETRFSFGALNSKTNRTVLDEFVSYLGTDLNAPNDVEIPAGDLSDSPFSNFDQLQASGYDVAADINLKTESSGRYFMIDQTLLDDFRIIGGYRYESNKADVSANRPPKLRGAGSNNPLANLPTDGGYDVSDWYPGVSVIYDITDNLNLRFAYSSTIALPSAREVSPYASSSFQGSNVDVGNPELKPSNVESFDIGIGYLSDSGDSFSVTVFQKTVEDRIEKLTGLGVTKFEPRVSNDPFDLRNYPELFVRSQNILGGATLLSWYNNPNEAKLKGVEIDARKNLGFLNESLSNFSVGGNFTYIEGEVDRFAIEIAAKNQVNAPVSDTRVLTDQPESILNFDLTYDNQDLGLSVSLVYYMISDVLEAVSLQDSYDVYREAYDQLDLTLSKEIGERFKLSLSAKNITNSTRGTYYEVEDRQVTRDSFKEGISYSLSGTYNF